MKKVLLVVASVVLMVGLFSCGTSKVESEAGMAAENGKGGLGGVGGVQIPNPFVTYDNLEDAAKRAGFSMTLPDEDDLPDWIIRTDYRATETNLLEIIYPGDEEYMQEIRLRKAISDEDDMSGDYRFYEEEKDIKIGGKNVTVRLNGGLIYLAIWRDGKFAYSAHISDGVTEDELASLIKVIK